MSLAAVVVMAVNVPILRMYVVTSSGVRKPQ
jgi:hypothetical protein